MDGDKLNIENKKEIFVPGRLCLFGEHSDWAGRYTDINSELVPGYAIVTGIDLGIYGDAEKSEKFIITAVGEDGVDMSFDCRMDLATLKEKAGESHFFSYACGVAAYMLEHYQVSGLSINISKTTLPVKKGLSSSAAICVFVTRAFNEIYKLKLNINGEMLAAYRGELYTHSRCGRLDQVCAYGVRCVCVEFSGDNITVEKLSIGKNLYWVFCDLNANKDTRKILSDLHKAYPFAQNVQDENVQKALGIENQSIIKEAIEYLSSGDAVKIGELMCKAQELFDTLVAPACPSELNAPKLHSVLNDEKVKQLSLGGKGVGSQGDGAVQFITSDRESQAKLVDYLNNELKLHAYPFSIKSSDRVKKAIIPLAGFGTRMYPATRFVKKEFLPVVDSKGRIKPVIMYILEELDEAGIEEIILVIGENEVEYFNKMFLSPLSEQHIEKLPVRVHEYERIIARIGKKIKLAVQSERRGFGHAVYQAHKFLDNEPAILLLGDFIYKSNLNETCTRQTINAYRKSGGQLTVALKEVPINDVVHYGVLSGTFNTSTMMNVNEMAEKPSVEYASDFLGVHYKNSTKYFSTFGQYILTPEVFDYLEEDILLHDKKCDESEIQLTTALQKVLEKKGMTGILVDGNSYDVGMPSAYLETMKGFSE